MADAKTKAKSDEPDQSMEEILQSIRRIIAEEGDDPGHKNKDESDSLVGSDILELTDMVKDDGSVVNIKSIEEPAMVPEPVFQAPANDVLSNIDDALTAKAQPAPRAAKPFAPMNIGEGLMSKETVAAAAQALKPISEAPMRNTAPAPRIESPNFRSGETVEDMVMESLKPMLKEWLDANLKTIVERLVEKEIKRIVALNSD